MHRYLRLVASVEHRSPNYLTELDDILTVQI